MIACGDHGSEVAVVPLVDGLPGAVRIFDLDLPDRAERPIDAGLTYGVIHPGGGAAGVVQSNLATGLVRFSLDEQGIPEAAIAETMVEHDGWLTMARWTLSGHYLLVADVAWGPAPTDAVLNGSGSILSFALSPEDDRRSVVSSALVSKSPETFELNRAGDLLVAVNMERTYLPGGPLAIVPGRGSSSLSLLTVDDVTGELATVGAQTGVRGVLPEGVVFDRNGDQIAIVVYQDHAAPRSDGWVEFFAIDAERAAPPIIPTGRRLPMPRGAHYLVVVD